MADDSEKRDHHLKFALLGDGTTGKTSIASRISQNNISKNYNQTLGFDFFLRRMELPGDVQVAIQICDIGGQSVGGKMLDKYLYGVQAVLFVYDITNYSSFENIEDWLSEVRRIFRESGQPLPHMSLVANKLDMEHMRTVNKQKHINFAQKHNMSSYFVSAKTDDMVYQCFLKTAASILNVRLAASDIEIAQKVIVPEITPHTKPKLIGTGVPPISASTSSLTTRRTKSVICSLQ